MNYQILTMRDVPDPQEMDRIPDRPLSLFSDFVTMELPAFLLKIKSGEKTVKDLSDIAENLAIQVPASSMNSSLAHLDAFMLRTAITQNEGNPGHNLNAICRSLSEDLDMIEGLTYEDLIHSNPLSEDPRFFTGRSEMFFYGVHVKIEAVCAQIISDLQDILAMSRDQTSMVASLREELLPGLHFVKNQMLQLNCDLPDADFSKMRPYFTTNKGENIKGPSGNFSSGIFVIDSMIYGDSAEMQEFQETKLLDLRYFPRTSANKDSFAGRDDMIRSHIRSVEGVTVNASVHMDHAGNRDILRSIFAVMSDIRKVHFGLGIKYLVRPLVEEKKMEEEDVEGSAKTKLKEYLMRARMIYDKAINDVSI